MRKLFTFLVAFLATVSGAVWGQTYGSEQSDPIVINGGTHDVTLNGVNLNAGNDDDYCAFEITGNATVNLTITGDNYLYSGSNKAGIYVEKGSTLIIDGTGSLHARSHESWGDGAGHTDGAGIGGDTRNKGDFGTIWIKGGTITAECITEGDASYARAAGIGGGYGSTEGTIIITGGTVNAHCRDTYDIPLSSINEFAGGAGIGGGYSGTCTSITILGGNITAGALTADNKGTDVAYSIGCGRDNSKGAPSIIFGKWSSSGATSITSDGGGWDFQGNRPEDQSGAKFLDARNGYITKSVGTVTMPEGTQMYLESEPTGVNLNAYFVEFISSKLQADGDHTVTGFPTELQHLYYGKNCSIEVPNNLTCSASHFFMGWLKGNAANQGNEIIASTSNQESFTHTTGDGEPGLWSNNKTVYTSVWVDNDWPVTVKSGTVWEAAGNFNQIFTTPADAVNLLTYTLCDDVSSYPELNGTNAPNKSLRMVKNYFVGSPTLNGTASKSINLTVEVSVTKSGSGAKKTVTVPMMIYDKKLLFKSVALNNIPHSYNGNLHNDVAANENHLLKVTAVTDDGGTGSSETIDKVTEGVFYRICQYTYTEPDGSVGKTIKYTDEPYKTLPIKEAGTYSEIILEPLIECEFAADGTGFTIEDGKAKLTNVTITVAQKEVIVSPNADPIQSCEVGETPIITFTPAVGAKTGIGTETYNYSGFLSLPKNATDTKGEYEIQQNNLAFADATNGSGFKASNYKMNFQSGVKFKVLEDITDNDNIQINIAATELTYNGLEQDPQITITGFDAGATEGKDYTVTVAPTPEQKAKVAYTNAADLRVKNAGSYTVTLTGQGLYTGTKTATFTVKKAQITKATAEPQTVTLGKVEKMFDNEASAKTVTLKGIVPADEGKVVFDKINSALKLAAEPSTYTEARPYTDAIEIEKLALKDADDGSFLADNYDMTNVSYVAGNLIVETDDQIDITDPTGDIDFKKGTMVYNGKTPADINLSVSIKGEPLAEGKYTVTYKKDGTTLVDNDEKLNVGNYSVTVTIEEGSHNGSIVQKSLNVTQRPLKVNFVLSNLDESYIGKEIQAADYVSYSLNGTNEGLVKGEEPIISGTFKIANQKNVNGKYDVEISDLKINDSPTFSSANYKTVLYVNGTEITVDGNGAGTTEIEDPTNPDEGGDGGDGQDPTKYYNIYDVTEYDFIDVSFSRNVVREGGSVNVYLGIPEGLDPTAVTLMYKRGMYNNWETLDEGVQPGEYPINNIWSDIYVKAVVDESYIDPNPDENHIYIDLSETNDSIWLYTERKLVEEGKTAVIQAEVAKSCQNKEIRYMYKRTVLGEWKEMPKDYSINQYVVRDITTDIYVKAYFVFDKQDPTTAKNPHHVYADITATCEGLYLDATRHKVADEGDTKVFLYVKKGFETKDARYLFKRGLKGEWEDLVPGIEQNTFQVTDIEGDIYLKGIDAIYTGTEDIDGMVRVYTKDGSLFVYTAQPEEISVVSMTGVTVKRTRQTGLQSYPLNQGIYVVCVGEQVFKVRVK